jgi:hypothetical protein
VKIALEIYYTSIGILEDIVDLSSADKRDENKTED